MLIIQNVTVGFNEELEIESELFLNSSRQKIKGEGPRGRAPFLKLMNLKY